jgi:small-conductance mechanosensitive channel
MPTPTPTRTRLHDPHLARKLTTPARIIFTSLIFCVSLTSAALVNADDQAAISSDAIIHHLSALISWYRDSTTKVQPPGFASDAIYQGDARTLAEQALRLAFDSARAAVPIVNAQGQQPASDDDGQPAQGATQSQNLAQFKAKTSAHLADLQAQLDSVNKQLATAPPRARAALQNQRDNLQGQIEVSSAILDSVGKLLTFIENGNDTPTEGLQGSIDALARSVPEVFSIAPTNQKTENKPAAQVTPAANQTQAAAPKSSGLIGEAGALYTEMTSIREIDQLASETQSLRDIADALRQPLRSAMKAIIQQSSDLEKQAQATGSNPAPTANLKPQYDALATKFKSLSAALVPLSQEVVVLDQSKANLLEWRRSITRQSGNVLRALVLHVGTIVIALGLVLVLSEVWRRATFRYIQDVRRRRQFLSIRRFVVGFLMGIVLVLGFVSEFSSLATFAGLVTAGIAVGLQAVLLSIAAYFFLMGRYGIRVGERVSVAGVTGDVVDIGLVRLYIMELAASGGDLYPTGRIAVFSNSVFFQAGMPFYKQIPGTDYTWHEVAVPIVAGSNYKSVEEKILQAVNSVYDGYRKDIERQHTDVERRIDIYMQAPNAEPQLRFTDKGLEFRVRYPVELRKASSIDDEITQRVLEAVNGEHDLKAAVSGPPTIRTPVGALHNN